MNQLGFQTVLDNALQRTKLILCRKREEYAPDTDVLLNFKWAGAAQGITPEAALVAFMAKHFVSIAMMAKEPNKYSIPAWQEKLTDIRNYTILLEALLEEGSPPE